MNLIAWVDQRNHWWKTFVLIFAVSVCVVGYIGFKTYEYAPPIADFVDEEGQIIFPAKSITDGKKVFLRYGLMEYGSFLGDGGLRGPDFTGEALNRTAQWMNQFYEQQQDKPSDQRDQRLQERMVQARVQMELKENRYDREKNA